MSVWFCIPSKRPYDEAAPILRKWRERGYHVAIQRDRGDTMCGDCYDMQSSRDYAGYAEAVNNLVRCVLVFDPQAEWLVTGGDDIEPDPNHTAEEIAQECSMYFARLHAGSDANPGVAISVRSIGAALKGLSNCAFGVMQPTGDRDFGDKDGPYIERVAGSPWMGREFCRRMYGGRGPLCEQYFHMGEDEELQAVATMLGVFWQRPDLVHRHNHWGRPRKGEKMGLASRMPPFLLRANSQEEWQRYKRIFAERKAAGFPGHEPIA